METPDLQGAYPRLSDAQVAALTALGERRAAQPEEVLFREGQRNGDFFVVLAGNVAVVEARGTREERTIAVHGRHRFLGELGLLTGEASYFTAVAVDAGEVLAVAHSPIAPASRSYSIWSGCRMHACAIPFTAACTVAGAECRRNTSGEVVVPPVKPRVHWEASGTCASTARLCSSSQPAGRRPGPPAPAHTPAPIAP